MADNIFSLLGGMKKPTPTESFAQGLLGYQRPSMSMEPMAQNMLGYQPSSIELDPMARTIQPSMMDRVSSGLGGIGSAFTGPGSNARLQALAASLLTGPSRTPISLGSQLAKGLLAGSQAVQAERQQDLTNLLMTANIEAKLREASGFDKTFGNEKDMRKEYNDLTKDFRESLAGFNKVKEAAALDTGAGDIALIFGFMKTIDPSSVVRESEFDLAQNTGGAPDRAKAYINRVINGQRLTPDQRKYFIDAAASQMDAIASLQKDVEARYTYLSTKYGYDPKNIVDEYSSRYTKDASIVVGTKENPHIVSSEAEGDKLPEGTYYQVGNTIYQSDGGVR